jgi:hypothetical protein
LSLWENLNALQRLFYPVVASMSSANIERLKASIRKAA